MKKPKLGITMGDAAGIGPELILKAFRNKSLFNVCKPLIIGSADVLNFYIKKLGISVQFKPIMRASDAVYRDGSLDVLDLNEIDVKSLKIGKVSPEPGRAAVIYIQEAGRLACEKTIDAIVSAPLNKESMRLAGYNFEGQTQILAEATGSKRYGMILLLGNIRVMMLTTHMALRDACDAVKKEKVLSMIELAHKSLTTFGIENPKIAVAGLNPHAGDGGIFGDEETKELVPAIKEAVKTGINTVGPVPADIVFIKAVDGEYDLVLAMYHDQANMAAKLLGFGDVVTVLAGLPIIRTSVGHGTAFDIAGKGVAMENNFIRAIEVAIDMVLHKKRIKK
jgi:4-hydroxythreonine-4-phosphate dehydrogenase